ncbi:LptF/LptG family permease [SAR86 cluster bacterium]|nr:LptF/LptG family permease [SAR86 cluster bacterium]
MNYIFYKHLFFRSLLTAIIVVIFLFSFDLFISLATNSDMFNKNFSKILTDQLGSSFRNVLQYFEILMLIAVLISLARFRESGNLNFLQSLSISPFKILLLSSLGPILLSLLFMYAGQKSNLLNELSSKNDYFLVSDKAIFHHQPEEQKIFKLSEDNALEVIYSRANEENIFNILYESAGFKDTKSVIESISNNNFVLPKESKNNLKLKLLPFTTLGVIFLSSLLVFSQARVISVGRVILYGLLIGFSYKIINDLIQAIFMAFSSQSIFQYIILPVVFFVLGVYGLKKSTKF